MPSHTTAERKKRSHGSHRRPRRATATRTVNDIIAASQQQLSAVNQQQGVVAPAPVQPAAPQAPSLASRARVAAQVAPTVALAAGQQIRQLPGQVGSAVGNALIPAQPSTAQEAQQALIPADPAEVERRLASRTRGVKSAAAQIVADRQAQPTSAFDVAVNRTLNDPNAPPFNAPPAVLRAAEEAAGGPIALGRRFAASRQRQRLQDLAASSETLEVRNGRLRPREDIVAKALKELPAPSPLSPAKLRASQDAHKKLRAAQAKRRTERREDITSVRLATISDVQFKRARERREANIEAGGSISRLRQQKSAAAERKRLIDLEALKIQVEANKISPERAKIIAAGLGSDFGEIAGAAAREAFGGGGQTVSPDTAPVTPSSQKFRNKVDLVRATLKTRLKRELSTNERFVSVNSVGIALEVGRLGILSRTERDQIIPRIEADLNTMIRVLEDMGASRERDAFINTLISTMMDTIQETSGPIDILLADPQARRKALTFQDRLPTQVVVALVIQRKLEALKSTTTRSRDQGSS